MHKFVVISLTIGALAVGILTWQNAAPAQERAAPSAPPVQKWEYKIIEGRPSEKDMNRLGDDGWELVTHTIANYHTMTFKRPKK